MFDNKDEQSPLVTITRIAMGENQAKEVPMPDLGDLPVLPTKNLVLFPEVTAPIGLTREVSKIIAETASKKHILVGIICQNDPETDDPELNDLDKYGVVAQVINVVKLPNGINTAIVHALSKFRVTGKGNGSVMKEAPISVAIRPVKDTMPRNRDGEFQAMISAVRDAALKLAERGGEPGGMELAMNLRNIDDPEILVNTIACLFPFEHDFKLHLLSLHRIKDRAFEILRELAKHEEMLELTEVIKNKAKKGMEEHQRNAFLHEQLDAIREELYGSDADEIDELEKKAKEVEFSTEARKVFEKELDKLRRCNPQSPDYSVQYNYLELLLSLPWGILSDTTKEFPIARDILDDDHYGLEKVKERILEQLAVMLHKPDGKAPIICFVGAPGVGKTSLGKSIAKALNRKYERVSLGGVHDEAEIRGHRRTYIGSMPGRIVDALKRAGSSNPVMLLDEIDKLGNDYKGDPSAALLEVLDPEQNSHFHDNYVDVDFDLSKVLFIATANTLSTLPQPLVDRMEIIEIPGYVEEEKTEIAKRHLIPKQFKELALEDSGVEFSDDAIKTIIEEYTSESGVRQLEKNIASVLRKFLLRRMNGDTTLKEIDSAQIRAMLGLPLRTKDKYEGNDYPGVVTGLAWTASGGEILFIETSLVPGKGEKLSITGNLGDVMKESATLSLQFIKSHAKQLGIEAELFEKYNIHLHVPEGAIPKDGPSAGITMVVSMVSAFKQVLVKERTAMTGEMTLRGKVLPVGGIKEKILAAKRAGIQNIILCKDNEKDVKDIPEKYLEGLQFIYVDNIIEVLDVALTDKKPAVPLV